MQHPITKEFNKVEIKRIFNLIRFELSNAFDCVRTNNWKCCIVRMNTCMNTRKTFFYNQFFSVKEKEDFRMILQ